MEDPLFEDNILKTLNQNQILLILFHDVTGNWPDLSFIQTP